MSRAIEHVPVIVCEGCEREPMTTTAWGLPGHVRGLRLLLVLALLFAPVVYATPPLNAHRVVGHPPATLDGMRYSRPFYEFVRVALPTSPCAEDPGKRCHLPAHCIIVERDDAEVCYWTSVFYAGDGFYVVPVRMNTPLQRVRIRFRNQVTGETTGVVGWWRVMDLSTVSYEAETKRRAVRR